MKKPCKKSSTTATITAAIDLAHFTEIELLEETADILVKPGDITVEDQARLDAINEEFIRRDRL